VLEKHKDEIVEELYDAILSNYVVGEYGEATLEPDENRLTAPNRMKAAGRRNLAIELGEHQATFSGSK